MVTLPVSLEIVVLSEPLPAHLALVPVLALLRAVEDLVDPQLVLPPEALPAGGALEGGLPRVRHLVVPQQLHPVVLDGAVGALVAVEVEVFLHHVGLQLSAAFERGIAGITDEGPLACVDEIVGLQTRGGREGFFT